MEAFLCTGKIWSEPSLVKHYRQPQCQHRLDPSNLNRKGRPKLHLFEGVLHLKFKNLLGNKTNCTFRPTDDSLPALTLPHVTFPGSTAHPVLLIRSPLPEVQLTVTQLQMPASSSNKKHKTYHKQISCFKVYRQCLFFLVDSKRRPAINHCLLSALRKRQSLINAFPLQAHYWEQWLVRSLGYHQTWEAGIELLRSEQKYQPH